MAMSRCPQGHYYDKAIYGACPHCGAFGGGDDAPTGSFSSMDGMEDTRPLNGPTDLNGGAYDHTMPLDGSVDYIQGGADHTARYDNVPGDWTGNENDHTVSYQDNANDEKTEAFLFDSQKEQSQRAAVSVRPVTGWLVCIEGPERGRDYRLQAENNFIGRDVGMDVVIRDDPRISREKHFVITYDPRSNAFYLIPGDGGDVLCNGEIVFDATKLQDGDRIGAGDSVFTIVFFCKEGRTW